MNKVKAYMITGSLMVVLGCIIYMMHQYDIWSYYTLMQIFGYYGFLAFGMRFWWWLVKPENDQQNKRTYKDWASYGKK